MNTWYVKSVYFSIDGPQVLYPNKFFSSEEEGKSYIATRKQIADISGTAVVQSTDMILTTVDYEYSLHNIEDEKEIENASA